jgi:spore germination cell wall hydrolase CwlJ-like protein
VNFKLKAALLAGAILFPVSSSNADPYMVRSAECLALNMYHEARNQGTAGILAVTGVVFNRVNDKRFPNTICAVVEQGPTRESWKTKKTLDKNDAVYYPVKNRCQFSWFCDGKSDVPKDEETYIRFLDYAKAWLNNTLPFLDITDGALFYHADYVTPGWAKTKQKTVEIQDHIFYRWEIK